MRATARSTLPSRRGAAALSTHPDVAASLLPVVAAPVHAWIRVPMGSQTIRAKLASHGGDWQLPSWRLCQPGNRSIFAQCKLSSWLYCGHLDVPCDYSQGSTASDQFREASHVVGDVAVKPCTCSEPPLKISTTLSRSSLSRTKDVKVHFASLMDICPLRNAEFVKKHQKYKGRAVLRGDIVKNDSRCYVVFTEQGPSRIISITNDGRKSHGYHPVANRLRRTSSGRSIRLHSKLKLEMLRNY